MGSRFPRHNLYLFDNLVFYEAFRVRVHSSVHVCDTRARDNENGRKKANQTRRKALITRPSCVGRDAVHQAPPSSTNFNGP